MKRTFHHLFQRSSCIHFNYHSELAKTAHQQGKQRADARKTRKSTNATVNLDMKQSNLDEYKKKKTEKWSVLKSSLTQRKI